MLHPLVLAVCSGNIDFKNNLSPPKKSKSAELAAELKGRLFVTEQTKKTRKSEPLETLMVMDELAATPSKTPRKAKQAK